MKEPDKKNKDTSSEDEETKEELMKEKENDENTASSEDEKSTGGDPFHQMPSAASVGFSTKGMTLEKVKDVCEGVKPVPKAKQKAKAKAKVKAVDLTKAEESDASSDISISSTPAVGSSTSSSTTTTSTSSSNSAEKKDDPAPKACFKIREEFPKSCIRRWMTRGSRFPVPENLSSLEARRAALARLKQLKMDQLLEKKNSLPEQAVEGEEEADESREAKDAKKDPKERPIPTHRRRQKSGRSLACFMTT